MFDELIGVLTALGERIQHHREHVGQLEARTRVCLIDPLLGALGWDVGDPAKVRIESEVGGTGRRVDYALLGERGQPIAFVEAKKLSVRDPALEQTAAYVFAENDRRNTNVRYCIWTNGDSWLAWDIYNQRQRRLIDARVTDSPAPKTALKLAGLWRESLLDGSFLPPTAFRDDEERETPAAPSPAAGGASPEQGESLLSPSGRLTEAGVRQLTVYIEAGELTQAQMAERLGISQGGVAYHVKQYRDRARG